jgi:hypothetical protein
MLFLTKDFYIFPKNVATVGCRSLYHQQSESHFGTVGYPKTQFKTSGQLISQVLLALKSYDYAYVRSMNTKPQGPMV